MTPQQHFVFVSLGKYYKTTAIKIALLSTQYLTFWSIILLLQIVFIASNI